MIDWEGSAAVVAAALRARGVESDLPDADLKAYATAAVQEITARGYGPQAAVDWVAYGSGTLISLYPAALSVADIEEDDVALTEGVDFRLRPGGMFLERLSTDGYVIRWGGRITGTTTLAAQSERYDRVVVDLVKLALEFSGLDSRRDGDYAEESIGARGGGQEGYQEKREELIGELAPAGAGFA
jgi:hypothetical protein